MADRKPLIHVIGTGGTIAGIGPDKLDYTQYAELGKKFSIRQSLDRISEINALADIES